MYFLYNLVQYQNYLAAELTELQGVMGPLMNKLSAILPQNRGMGGMGGGMGMGGG